MNNSVSRFEQLKRNFEHDYALFLENGDASVYADSVQALALGVAYSVVNKCIDPQRKQGKSTGQNPAMIALKRGLAADNALLDNTRRANNAATRYRYNSKGNLVYEIVDPIQNEAAAKLIEECLTDGIDLQYAAVAELIDLAKTHASNGGGWLDKTYTTQKLDKRVYIRTADNAKWQDIDTCPIVEVYRAVRELVSGSRAIKADLSGYTYIEGMADGLEPVYIRMGKYEDTGSTDTHGNYSADSTTANTIEDLVVEMNLTKRQMQVLRYRLKGF